MHKHHSHLLRSMMKNLRIYWAATLVISSVGTSAASDNWPRFLGPNGQAVQESANPPLEIDSDDSVAWKSELPIGHSSPCIWGDSIFLTGYVKDSQTLETISIDRSTGKIRWRKACPSVDAVEKCHKVSNPAVPTPTTDGETVVVYFGSYGLIAYDFDGNELWQHPLPMAKAFRNYGSGSSPILVNGKVIQFVSLGNQSYLGAFDLADGSELWKSKGRAGRTWATPTAWTEESELRIGLLASSRFTAYSESEGQEKWWCQGLAANSGASPMVKDDTLFLSSAGMQGDEDNIVVPEEFDAFVAKHDQDTDGQITFKEIPNSVLFTNRKTSDGAGNMTLKQALRFMGIKADHVFDKQGWEEMRKQMTEFKNSPVTRPNAQVVRAGGSGNVTKKNRVWQTKKGIGEVPSPLLYEEQVYLVKNGGVLTVLGVENGDRIYTRRLRGATGGYYATPVAAAGRIYFASDSGVVTVVEAGPKLKILSQRDFREPIFATPAIVGDTLYLRTQKHLYALKST